MRMPPPAAFGDLSTDDDLVAGVQSRLDVAAAEPDGFRVAAGVGQLGDHALRAAAESLLDLQRVDAHLGGLLLVGDQTRQRTKVAEVVIAKRQVEEGLPWRPDAEALQRCGMSREVGQRAAQRPVEISHAQLPHGNPAHLAAAPANATIRSMTSIGRRARLDCMARS